MLIDTHCHIDILIKKTKNSTPSDIDFQSAQNFIGEAEKNGVAKLISLAVDYQTSLITIQLAQAYPAISCSVGIHPCDIKIDWKDELKKIEALLIHKEKNKIVAIGEIGLDFYHPGFDKQRQIDGLKAQIELALTHNLPVALHTRNSIDETLHVIDAYKHDGLKGVFHCFSHDQSIAQTVFDYGFMVGIGCIITYPKNNYLRDLVIHDNLQHCVLETDAPFLPPQWIRGQQNTPAQTKPLAEYIANLLSIPFEEVARITTHNAEQIFSFF